MSPIALSFLLNTVTESRFGLPSTTCLLNPSVRKSIRASGNAVRRFFRTAVESNTSPIARSLITRILRTQERSIFMNCCLERLGIDSLEEGKVEFPDHVRHQLFIHDDAQAGSGGS